MQASLQIEHQGAEDKNDYAIETGLDDAKTSLS
jgi:hypothetical protein